MRAREFEQVEQLVVPVPVWMLKSIVREALLRSVAWTAPPVRFQSSQESMVPKGKFAAVGLRGRRGRCRGASRSLVPEK